MEIFETKTPYSIEFYPGQSPLVLRLDYIFPHEKVNRANFAAMYKLVLQNSYGELNNADLQLRAISVTTGFDFKSALSSYSRWGGFANVFSDAEKELVFPDAVSAFIAQADSTASLLAKLGGFTRDRFEDFVLKIIEPRDFRNMLRNEHERSEFQRYLVSKWTNGIPPNIFSSNY